MTVRDLIKDMFSVLNVFAAGESVQASDEQEALRALNTMLDTWSGQGIMIFKQTSEEFTLSGGTGSYTLGPTGDFITTRPHLIENATLKSGQTELPVDVINVQQYSAISNKTASSNIPQKMYVDGGFPNLTLKLHPVPSEANALVLYSLKPLASFASVNDSVSLPPGYTEALIYNLAKRLARRYGKAMAPEDDEIARDAITIIKRKNSRPVYMRSDVMGLIVKKPFNIITGE